jgi:outer membrane scaffolding protein for murein synthesis (MipA/OmpV family)
MIPPAHRIPNPRNSPIMATRLLHHAACLLFALPAVLPAAEPQALSTPGSAPTTTTEKPAERNWRLSVGAGAWVRPVYPGSAETDIAPIPFVEARWEQLFLSTGRLGAPFAGLRLPLIQDELLVYAGASYFFGRDADDLPVTGQEDIDPTMSASGIVEWTPGNYILLVRGLAHTDLLDNGHGTTVSLQTFLRAPPLPHLRIQAGVGVTYLNDQATDTWFGTTGTSPYETEMGVRDAQLLVEGIAPLDKHWTVVGRFTWSRLVGDPSDSPVTERKNGLTAIMGLTYAF